MVRAVAESEYENSNGRMQPEKVTDTGLLIALSSLIFEGALRPKRTVETQ